MVGQAVADPEEVSFEYLITMSTMCNTMVMKGDVQFFQKSKLPTLHVTKHMILKNASKARFDTSTFVLLVL